MSKKEEKSNDHSPWRDLAGFILLAVAVFLLLCVVSYSPLDPSLHTTVTGENPYIHNYCGIFGSYIADIFMQLFGFSSYVLPLFLGATVWAFVFRPSMLKASLRFVGVILFMLATTLLLAMIAGDQPRIPPWGGALGHYQRLFFIKYTGNAGAFLFSFTSFALSLVFTIGLTFEFFLTKLINYVQKAWGTKAWVAPLLAKIKAKTGEILETEQSHLEKSMAEIRKSEKSEAIKIAGVEIKEETSQPKKPEKVKPDKNLDEIPIVIAKPKKAPEMPKFHADEGHGEETKKPKPQRSYKLPDITLLEAPEEQTLTINREELFENAQILERKLKDFGVFGKVVEVQPGPVVTMYEFEPAPGVKVQQITRLNDDLALALKAMSVRITPIPGKAVIGIEVSNRDRHVVYLKDILSNDNFGNSTSNLTLALGKDISGIPAVADLRRMPHLLVAGATGSGKSVAINSMILSVLYKSTPDEVRMILVDPKMLELSLYDDIPHLLLPVVTDPRKAAAALRWSVLEMERRYRLMADIGVRNIEGYNKKVFKVMDENATKKKDEVAPPPELPLDSGARDAPVKPEEHTGSMPYIMIVIDELADLMMVSSREVEDSIIRLAQMARAAGIHLMLATQRPSVDVITGVIKANMPARISFQVSSKVDSRTILDANGAELLLGAGDMLFLPPGTSKIARVHGCFVTDNEVKKVTDFWKEQGDPDYDHNILKVPISDEAAKLEGAGGGEDDEMYSQALNIIRAHGVASISLIQRKLRIGYNRAARLVERMEEEGLLAPGEVGKPREVLMSRFET